MSAISKKLLIKPGTSWLFLNAPVNYLASLEPLPENAVASFIAEEVFDGIQLFVKDTLSLAEGLQIIMPILKYDTIFWISYPKKSSGIESDLEMMGRWDGPTRLGLGVVASASIDNTWTALRFRPVSQAKLSGTSNASIKGNDYFAYINPDKKTLTLPLDLQQAMEKQTTALANYNNLSYSNRKEYLLWVLTAKQEKTRVGRIEKTIEKLLAGKKNPSEK